MPEELSDTLKIGRLENKFDLYEPMLRSLHGIVSIPAEIGRIQDDLKVLTESRVAVREQLVTLFKAQDKNYRDMVKSLEGQAKLLEKEIAECPIDSVVVRVADVERDMGFIDALDDRIKDTEEMIDSFKLKGWDLLFRISPWVIAAMSIIYAATNH